LFFVYDIDYVSHNNYVISYSKIHGVERVQSLADISRSALCCHSNETQLHRLQNPRNSAQLEGTPYHFPKLYPGPCSSVGMRRGTDRQTAVTNIRLTRNVIIAVKGKGKGKGRILI